MLYACACLSVSMLYACMCVCVCVCVCVCTCMCLSVCYMHACMCTQEVDSDVFNKLLHLTQLVVKNIDKDFSKNPHGCLSSVFVLLRLSCLVCLKTTTNKSDADTLQPPTLSCGDQMTPLISSIPSYTSLRNDDDDDDDLSEEAVSCPSARMTDKLQLLNINNKFIYHDLFKKPLSQYACFANDQFWKTVFISMVSLLRKQLGWDEKTAELYQRYTNLVQFVFKTLLKSRYSSISESGQQKMADEEDELLTSVLINLATFMSIAGVCSDRSRQFVTNLVAYLRLGHRSDSITSVLKVSSLLSLLLPLTVRLQETWRGKDVKLVPLYIKKSTSFMAHLGRNKLGTACKVQVSPSIHITNFTNVCVYVHFSARFWRMC